MDNLRIRKIKWHPKTNKISQVPSEGLEYAFVSEEYEQIHQLVWCKDFMQDAIHAYLNNMPIEIYGFTYDPKTDPPVYLKKTRLLVTNWKDQQLAEKMSERCLPFLNAVEDKLNMPHSIIEKCSHIPPIYARSGVWLIEGSKRWMMAPPMISLYTLLIRVGLVHDPDDNVEDTIKKVRNGDTPVYYGGEDETDKDFLEDAEDGIRYILKHGDQKVFYSTMKKNYPPLDYKSKYYYSIYSVHERCGIVAYSEGTTKDKFPYWHRFEGAKK